jgi:hypothetical protein
MVAVSLPVCVGVLSDQQMSRRAPSARLLHAQQVKETHAAGEAEAEDSTDLTEDTASIDDFEQEQVESGDEMDDQDQANAGDEENEESEEEQVAEESTAVVKRDKGKRKAKVVASADTKVPRLGVTVNRVRVTRVNI